MKIDEPKTPYNYQDPALNDFDQLDAGALAEKLKVAADSTSNDAEEEDGARARSYYPDEDADESDEEEKAPESEDQKGEEGVFCCPNIAMRQYWIALRWYVYGRCIAIEKNIKDLHLQSDLHRRSRD